MTRSPNDETGRTPDRHRLSPDLIGFRLLKLTNLMSQPFFARIAKQHDLTLNEWRSMVAISASPGCAAEDISAATGMHPMNISRAVTGLKKRGFVDHTPDPGNHRRILLTLSPAGRAKFSEIAPMSENQSRQLLSPLSEEEIEAFSRILDKLVNQAETMVP